MTHATREAERQQSNRFADWFLGGLESGLTYASSSLATPIAGITGALGMGWSGGDEGYASDLIEDITEKLTYKPQTDEGQTINRFAAETVRSGIEKGKEVPGVQSVLDADQSMKNWLANIDPALAAAMVAGQTAVGERLGIRGRGDISDIPTARADTPPTTDVMPFEDVAEASVGARTGTMGSNPGTVEPDYIPLMHDRQRVAYPGIYGRPDDIARAALIAPESDWLQKLWGVDRRDLFDIARDNPGNPEWIPEEWRSLKTGERKPGTSKAALNIQTPGNTQRVHDILGEVERLQPELWYGMGGWYPLDPLYQRQVQLLGPHEGGRAFQLFNDLTGMASPGSNVLDEVGRGTAAAYLARRGRFDEFLERGGTGGSAFPNDPLLAPMVGHPYHGTSQAPAMQRYLESDPFDRKYPDSAKVPSYIEQSYPMNFGNTLRGQRHIPVGDAHFGRGIGISDVRRSTKYSQSLEAPEANTVQPWFRGITMQHGIEAGPGQGILWGVLAPQTGVDVRSGVGAPKLELITQNIVETARRLGMSPYEVRDRMLRLEMPVFRNPAGQ